MSKIIKLRKVIDYKDTTVYPRTITNAVIDPTTGRNLNDILSHKGFGVCSSDRHSRVYEATIEGFKLSLYSRISVLFTNGIGIDNGHIVINGINASTLCEDYTDAILYKDGGMKADTIHAGKVVDFVYAQDSVSQKYGWLPIGLDVQELKVEDVKAILPYDTNTLHIVSTYVDNAVSDEREVLYSDSMGRMDMNSGFIGLYTIVSSNVPISMPFAYFGQETVTDMPIKLYYNSAWSDALITIKPSSETTTPRITRVTVGETELSSDEVSALTWELRGLRIGNFSYREGTNQIQYIPEEES